MGGIVSVCESPKHDDDLPSATEANIQILKDREHLPCIGTPSIDLDDKNKLQTIYVALYENGTELTLIFLDEDRPNAFADCLYDTLRRPLFGRISDIETIFIFNDGTVDFPGTYSGTQTWNTPNPSHEKATIDLSEFEKQADTKRPILWVNTWNHLIGEKNNNTTMPITYQNLAHLQSVDSEADTTSTKDFVIRIGSRNEIDSRFKGLISSVSKVMTKERQQKLGKRLQ